MPYWTDLYAVGNTPSDLGIYTSLNDGDSGRYFLIEWYKIPLYQSNSSEPTGSNPVTFEVKLFENGQIEFHSCADLLRSLGSETKG